jgi:hypothetical protein
MRFKGKCGPVRVENLALPHPNCGILSRLVHLSAPQFFICKVGTDACGVEKMNVQKCTQHLASGGFLVMCFSCFSHPFCVFTFAEHSVSNVAFAF